VVSWFLELSGGVVMPPSIKEVRSNLHEISRVASPPNHALRFDKSGVVNARRHYRKRDLPFSRHLGCCLPSISS
jgi:hypothetical protein